MKDQGKEKIEIKDVVKNSDESNNQKTTNTSNKKIVFEKVDKILNKIKYPLEFLLSLLLVYITFRLVYIHQYDGYWSMNHIIALIPTAIATLGMIIYSLFKSGKKIEKIFLAIVIPIGMAYLVFMTPSNVADEMAHLWKTYEVSQGIFISPKEPKTTVPYDMVHNIKPYTNSYDEYANAMTTTTDYNNMEEVNNTAKTYPFTLYIFSGLGMLIGKLMNFNILLASYLAQLVNFIVFLIASFYTLRLLPFGKLPMMVLLFTPMMLHQATSTSSDVLINASILLFIAFCMNLLFKKEKITRKEKIAFFALGVFIAIAKYVYLPVIGIGLLLIATKNMSKKSKAILLSSTFIISALLAIGWYLFTATYPSAYEDYAREFNVNSSEQISYLINNPKEAIKMIIHTIDMNGQTYIFEAIGSKLGWSNIFVNEGIIVAFLAILFASCFLEKNKVSLKAIQRIYMLLIAAGVSVLIIVGLYLIWTPVGNLYSAGVQGRYFIPIIPLIFLCLCMKNNYVKI